LNAVFQINLPALQKAGVMAGRHTCPAEGRAVAGRHVNTGMREVTNHGNHENPEIIVKIT
jgi:hypothetical protein